MIDRADMTWKPKLDKNIKPIYLALAGKLKQDICIGKLLPGTKLPPQRELASFLGINISTVTRAFKLCEGEGIISSVVGRGTFVSYDTLNNIDEKKRVIDLSSMMPETINQNQAIDLLVDMIREPDFRKLFQYCLDNVWQKKAAVRLLNSIGLRTDERYVLISSGAQNALCAIFVTLLKRNKKLATNLFVYFELSSLAKLFDIELVGIGDENGKITPLDIRNAYERDGISTVYLMPDMQDPTNYTMSLDERKEIAGVCKELGILIIEDGINSLLMDKKLPPIASFSDDTIYILSLSYAGVPALRTAYMNVPKKYYNILKSALSGMNISQSGLLLEMATRLIMSGDFNVLLDKRIKGLEKRNALVDEVFKGFDIRGNGRSLGRWLVLPKGVSGSEVEYDLLMKGVSVYAGKRFCVKEEDINAIRLAICAPESLNELEDGLNIVKKVVDML